MASINLKNFKSSKKSALQPISPRSHNISMLPFTRDTETDGKITITCDSVEQAKTSSLLRQDGKNYDEDAASTNDRSSSESQLVAGHFSSYIFNVNDKEIKKWVSN